MEIGNGIAIAGVWIFAAIFGASKTTTSNGAFLGMIIAAIVTFMLH